MPRPGPEPGGDETSCIRRVLAKEALLAVAYHLDCEADRPNRYAEKTGHSERFRRSGRHGGERRRQRQEDPKALQRPDHEKPGERRLDGVKSLVNPLSFDAQEQKASQPQRPDRHEKHDSEQKQLGIRSAEEA
jgi:hypothetical protein